MAILNRLNRLFKADVHAVLDRIEEPAAVLRQAIREMDSALADQSRQLRSLELEREQALRRRSEIERTLVTVSEDLDLSLAAGNEALARKSMRRKLEGERLLRVLDQRIDALVHRQGQLAPVVEQRREMIESLRQRAAVFEADAGDSNGPEATRWSAEDFCVSEADIDLALLRARQTRSAS